MEARASHPAGHGSVDGGQSTGEQLPAACPACGAGVRGDVTWCLRCYANLRPDPPSRPGSVDLPGPGPGSASASSDQHADDPQGQPGTGRAPRAALESEQVDALADRMLAELAASAADRPAWLGRAPRTPGAVILYGIVGLAAISIVLLGVGAAVGQVIGSR
jgi:hypothetical protein